MRHLKQQSFEKTLHIRPKVIYSRGRRFVLWNRLSRKCLLPSAEVTEISWLQWQQQQQQFFYDDAVPANIIYHTGSERQFLYTRSRLY